MSPTFTPTGAVSWHRMIALVSLTVAIAYTRASCPGCGKLLYLVPGSLTISQRRLERVTDGSGRGRVVSCKRCSTLCEVIET